MIRTVGNNKEKEEDLTDRGEAGANHSMLQVASTSASTAIITMRQEKQNVMENYDHYLKQNL